MYLQLAALKKYFEKKVYGEPISSINGANVGPPLCRSPDNFNVFTGISPSSLKGLI